MPKSWLIQKRRKVAAGKPSISEGEEDLIGLLSAVRTCCGNLTKARLSRAGGNL